MVTWSRLFSMESRMSTMEYKQVFEAPRRAGLSRFIKDECFKRGLNLELDVDKGWVRETVRVHITGPELDVRPLVYALESAVTWTEE